MISYGSKNFIFRFHKQERYYISAVHFCYQFEIHITLTVSIEMIMIDKQSF